MDKLTQKDEISNSTVNDNSILNRKNGKSVLYRFCWLYFILIIVFVDVDSINIFSGRSSVEDQSDPDSDTHGKSFK